MEQKEVLSAVMIYLSCILGTLWSIYQTIIIKKINVSSNKSKNDDDVENLVSHDKLSMIESIGLKISNGANAFLFAEYKIMTIFIGLFAIVVLLIVDIFGSPDKSFKIYATFAFVVGSFSSILCGFIGMRIAVTSNYRTTYEATHSLSGAFSVAYRAGCVMGFSTVSIALAVLLTIILAYNAIYVPTTETYPFIMELIAGYGLGGSAMALFGRVGGGIYTKAADVGADLVGKVEEGLDEDSPRNPATIADNVGDNVGDIAGMGSDLFGSFAESTCASLVVIANTNELVSVAGTLYYPLLISALGILACFFTSIVGIYVYKVDTIDKIENALKLQLLLSTLFVLVGIFPLSYICLPSEWVQDGETKYWYFAAITVSTGLICGFLIGIATDYYTSHSHHPVREMSQSCSSGPAINVIYGLALGYLSTIIPVILIAITILISLKLLGMFGVSLAAIGMLSTLAVGLAIDAYGPISDNAGGIAEMSELGEGVRNYTDALDAAGNTTAAVGKGFAIGSAALVSIALYGAFITRAQKTEKNRIEDTNINNPWIFCSLLIGSMLPYAFSALTMKSVGFAAQEMVVEVREQFKNQKIRNGEIEPDYEKCIKVSTAASLKEMIFPGLLVILTPIVLGVVFHPILIAGLLPGALLSGVQLAISMSNTGGAWDNAKKYIESGSLIIDGKVKGKGSDEHKAAVIGDTVGDPLKDTSGPSLNILIKLMAIISLVFAEGFSNISLLSNALNIK